MRGAETNIKNVQAMEEEFEAQALRALKRARATETLDEKFVEYKDYLEWRIWKEQQMRKLNRQKTLVVTGPSKMGKSEYLKAKLEEFAEEIGEGGMEVLVVNCMNVLDPDLKRFKSVKNNAILFDEGSPEMVQRHRDLFQAPRHEVILGNSATGCYTYSVLLWRVRLVLTSNSWFEDLAELKPKDREWVIENTVVLSVTEPMWVTEQPHREQSGSTGSSSGAAAHLAAAGA